MSIPELYDSEPAGTRMPPPPEQTGPQIVPGAVVMSNDYRLDRPHWFEQDRPIAVVSARHYGRVSAALDSFRYARGGRVFVVPANSPGFDCSRIKIWSGADAPKAIAVGDLVGLRVMGQA